MGRLRFRCDVNWNVQPTPHREEACNCNGPAAPAPGIRRLSAYVLRGPWRRAAHPPSALAPPVDDGHPPSALAPPVDDPVSSVRGPRLAPAWRWVAGSSVLCRSTRAPPCSVLPLGAASLTKCVPASRPTASTTFRRAVGALSWLSAAEAQRRVAPAPCACCIVSLCDCLISNFVAPYANTGLGLIAF
jgi:hypothetical protein